MAVGTGFGQVFRGIGKRSSPRTTGHQNSNLSNQVKSVESLFHQPFSNHALKVNCEVGFIDQMQKMYVVPTSYIYIDSQS